MTVASFVVNNSLKAVSRLLCRIDSSQLGKVPLKGPLILAVNHINFLDAPLIMTHLQPRPITGLVKVETWDDPLMAMLFNIWGAIPLKRGEADLVAFHKAQQALAEGKILAVAPEGTRSNHGRLQKGKAGIVLLAVRTGAPILPMVVFGGEKFHQNIRQLKRTEFNIVVGNPFKITVDRKSLSRDVREQITTEIMCQLASLLPQENRGLYSDLDNATESYLEFSPGIESNLLFARGQ